MPPLPFASSVFLKNLSVNFVHLAAFSINAFLFFNLAFQHRLVSYDPFLLANRPADPLPCLERFGRAALWWTQPTVSCAKGCLCQIATPELPVPSLKEAGRF